MRVSPWQVRVYLTTEVSIPVMQMTLRKIAVKLGVAMKSNIDQCVGSIQGVALALRQ
jgi:hypothetical protein